MDEDARQPRSGVRDRRLHRGTKTFDALIFGYFEGEKLIYVARSRNGFTPVTRAQLFKKFKGLEINECPFANLPEARSGHFLEWTGDNHLRRSKFVGLREDKNARDVVRQ